MGSPVLTFISVKYSYKSADDLSKHTLALSLDAVENALHEYSDSLKYSLHDLLQGFRTVYSDGRVLGKDVDPDDSTTHYVVKKMVGRFHEKLFAQYDVSPKELHDLLEARVIQYTPVVELFYDVSRVYSHVSVFNYADGQGAHVSLVSMMDKSYSVRYVFPVPEKDLVITAWNHFNTAFYNYDYYKIHREYDLGNTLIKLAQYVSVAHSPGFQGALLKCQEAQRVHSTHVEAFFRDPYVLEFAHEPAVSASQCVDGHGRDWVPVVLSVEQSLAPLSSGFFSSLNHEKQGRSFLVTPQAKILAYTPDVFDLADALQKQDKIKREVRNLVNSDVKAQKYSLRSIFDHSLALYKQSFLGAGLKRISTSYSLLSNAQTQYSLRESVQFEFLWQNVRYIAMMRSLPNIFHFEVFAGVFFPEYEFLHAVEQNIYLSVLVAAFSLLISVSASVSLSKSISVPLERIIQYMNYVRNLDLEKTFYPPDEILDFVEIEKLHQAFISMRTGLKSFKKYVPAKLIRNFISSEQEAVLGGETKILTVYFSDIADFTTISERLSPQQLITALGDYLHEMSTVIDQNSGTLDKYIGDAIMAFWGAPADVKEHAFLACKSALECQYRLTRLHYTRWNNADFPAFQSRIGINTGELIVGNMGSQQRMNYTVIGDSVNLASRLEGLNKFYGTRIMCSGYTNDLLDYRIVTRKLDFVAVKGKKDPVVVFEIVGFDGEVTPRELRFIQLYEEALELYLLRQFEKALRLFQETLSIKVDPAALRFVEHCEEYRVAPPPHDWNGVYVFTTK